MNINASCLFITELLVVHISYWTKQKFKNTTWTFKIVLLYIFIVKGVNHPLIYKNDIILDELCKIKN